MSTENRRGTSRFSIVVGRGPKSAPAARRWLGFVAMVAVAGVSIAGCGVTVEDVPLPKPGLTGDSYTVHAVFANVLNLPDHAKVRVGGSNVGVVTGISTENYQAKITMQVSDDVELPAQSTAQLRQATPLGDIYVALSKPPSSSGQQVLRDGDTIGADHTSAGATVEELLLSISALFNGGGIQRVAKVLADLDSIVGNRGPQLTHLLNEMTDVVGGLHQNTAKIDSVLNQFDTTFATLQQRRAELGNVADTLPSLVGTLAENNKRIGDLLTKVSVTSAALGDFSKTSKDQVVGLVDSTNRLMTGVHQMGDNLGAALDQLHVSAPKVLSSMRGSGFATATNATYLSIGALYDPGQRLLPGLTDFTDFFGSFADVLRHIYARFTSPPGPAPARTPPPPR